MLCRLLGQPSSSSCCERNWSTYGQIKTIKRNRLTPKRADDLVFVHSNLRLISRRTPDYISGPCSLWDCITEDVDFDVPIELEILNLSLDDPVIDPTPFIDSSGTGSIQLSRSSNLLLQSESQSFVQLDDENA